MLPQLPSTLRHYHPHPHPVLSGAATHLLSNRTPSAQSRGRAVAPAAFSVWREGPSLQHLPGKLTLVLKAACETLAKEHCLPKACCQSPGAGPWGDALSARGRDVVSLLGLFHKAEFSEGTWACNARLLGNGGRGRLEATDASRQAPSELASRGGGRDSSISHRPSQEPSANKKGRLLSCLFPAPRGAQSWARHQCWSREAGSGVSFAMLQRVKWHSAPF